MNRLILISPSCLAIPMGILAASVAAGPAGPAGAAQAQVTSAPERLDTAPILANGDANKRYFLIGAAKTGEVPAAGHALLIVLPGGDGSAEFHPFIQRIHKRALGEGWLIAQLVAPKWDENQSKKLVWPTERDRLPAAKFTTEQFIEAVIADVRAKVKVDRRRVFLLGWSSGGPPCYAMTLRKETPVAGAMIAMSVFQPARLPPLENGKGKAFYLLQSPEDQVTPMRFAEAARKALEAAGAKVHLERYPGGHGWHGDVFKMIGDGVKWLDQQAQSKPSI